MICPICLKYNFKDHNSFEVCPVCNWENDGIQANDHNYAGGTNSLSVNEERIEYFLLNNPVTHNKATDLRQKYHYSRKGIYSRFANINHVTEPERSEQQRQALKAAREEYVNKLSILLHELLLLKNE